jgi:hypothetical protein
MFKLAILISSIIFLLQGCNTASVKPEVANVTSTPSAATVYADDLKLGTTPLHHDLYDAFPASWKNSEYQAQGTLILKKTGCDDFSIKVNDLLLSKPVHADLKCSATTSNEAADSTAPPESTITKRLNEAESLFKQGVITEDEYNATRKRILNEI